MMTEFEDDVRAMLHRRAGDATASRDAWEQIQARLEADERPTAIVHRRPFQVVAGGAAAAAIAALVIGQVVPSPSSQVATETPVTEAPAAVVPVPDSPWVWPAAHDAELAATDPMTTATSYLRDRTGTEPTGGEVTLETDEAAQVLFRSGPVVSEVFLKKAGDRWFVGSAASDLIPMHMLTYDGSTVTGEVVAEADGSLTLRYEGPGVTPMVRPDQPVAFRDAVQVDQSVDAREWVTVAAVLRTDDGIFAVSESWQQPPGDIGPGGGEDAEVLGDAVWPATTRDELAGLDDAVGSGEQPWLSDPAEVALAFLEGEVLSGEVTANVGTFMQGDSLSGEVPFELSDGGRGLVLVRRASAEAQVWYVTFATTDGAPFDVRIEDGGITVQSNAGIATFGVEVRPLPDGEARSAAADGDTARIDGVTEGIVEAVGATADGGVAFTVSRTSAAG